MSVEAPISNTTLGEQARNIEAHGVYSLITDKGTNVIARRLNGSPIYAISGGCGTVILTDKNVAQGWMLSELVFISDKYGEDPRKNYPKSSKLPYGTRRSESVAEWYNEGDEVVSGFIHDHNSPYTVETPKGNKVSVRAR